MSTFIFKEYHLNESGLATFQYGYDDGRSFTETVQFNTQNIERSAVLESALYLAWVIAGISYYKCFAPSEVRFENHSPNAAQAAFFTKVYRDGLSQFVYENNLDPVNLPVFNGKGQSSAESYNGDGLLVLQSGGKDSLLLATLLQEKNKEYTPWYMQQSAEHPAILNELSAPLRTITRTIDRSKLAKAAEDGALNGHVPVTFITLAYALVDAVLNGENTILAAIGHEGEEPHAYIGDYAVTHQWSKTWEAEQLFVRYVHEEISPNLHVGSPLRGYSELKIAELFTQHAWQKFGHSFSSCNRANYQQDHDNSQLVWCGDCPKCANSYLLFAPFIASDELQEIFGGDLFAKPSLLETFKGLLGVDNAFKPFECVGEIDELRLAYHKALENGHSPLPFSVSHSSFNKDLEADAQPWAREMLQ